ncbi:MAG: MGMT family protein [Muribaculaceae bacterium]|nr:MGMT family protein [Muribaculaceae bacterium]
MIALRFLPYRPDAPTVRSFAVTPLGGVAIEVRQDGAIVSLTLCAESGDGDTDQFVPTIHQVVSAITDLERTAEIAVAPCAEGLQLDVLKAIATVPRLSLSSYSHIARLAGRPGAVRAVASCVGRNPVPLIVPCHRVIPLSAGKQLSRALASPRLLGNYTPDPRLKAEILRMEGYFEVENLPSINFLS